MIRKLLLGLALLATTTAPARAGVGIMCEGEGIEAHFPMGGAVGFTLLTAGVWVGDKATRRENDKGIVNAIPYQQSWVENRVNIDLVDTNREKITVRVRLVAAPDYDLLAGLIEVVDVNAFAVTCGIG